MTDGRKRLADADVKPGDMYFDSIARLGYVRTMDGWQQDELTTRLGRMLTFNPETATLVVNPKPDPDWAGRP